uniref:Ig-like domain-containing protein n=1 Tax=Ideonella sp. TaxID=1929293 RepID=UPI0037BF073E
MSSSNTPNSNTPVAAVLGSGSAATLTAAAKAAAAKAAAADAGLQDAIAKGYQPARILGGKVVGVWGGALLRTADGEMRPLKTGDVIKKGDVVLTTQDGIVQIEGAKTTNSALIDRVIADLGTPKPEEPPAAGIQGPGGADNFLPGLRVDRVVEAVTPAGLGFTEVAGDFEEIQFDTAGDERVSDGSEALPDTFTGAEDTPIVFNPITNDTPGNGGPLTVTSIAGQPIAVGSPVTLPQGVVTLNPNGTLTFTPNPNFVGTVSFPYTGANNNGTVSSTVSLTVTPVNDTPDAVNDVKAVIEDTPATGNVLTNDTDPDNDTLSVTGFTVDTNGDGTQEPFTPGQKATLVNAAGKPIGDLTLNANGAFTFNPAKDYVGPVPVVTYSITDGNGGTDSATLTLGPVSPVNDAPEGTDAIRQTYEDVPYVVQTKDFGFKDVDGDVLAAVRIDTLPTNGTLTFNGQPVSANQLISAADIAAGRLRFVPDADENGNPYGSFTFSVQDPSGTFDPVPNRFTLIVDPLAETPAANNDAIKTEEGKPVVIDVLANDKTPAGTTLTVTEINGKPVTPGTPVPITDSTGQPIGSVVVTPDGKVTFTPTPDYQGPVDFTYTATDGKTPVEGKVHVDVTPVNDVPLATDDKATIEAGKPTTLDVLGNDTDPDKDPLTISEINGKPVTPGTP